VVCLVWGTTYLAIRVAIETIPPLLMAGIRWMIAGSVLVGFFSVRGERLPAATSWPSLGVRGLLLIALGNGAVVWAEQTVPSGLASVFVALAPFWMVGVDALFAHGEVISARQWSGLLIGFAGILVLIWPQLGVDPTRRGFLQGVAATQLACAGWALGTSYARRAIHRQAEPPLTAPALEMLFGGGWLLIGGLALGEHLTNMVSVRSLVATAYLILFGSIVAFSSYRYAIQHLSVATVSLYVYVNTVLAMILGTLVLDEPFSWRIGASAAIVLVGIGLVKERNG
jgi:drug/metabolite transporter (DMT)-like permease